MLDGGFYRDKRVDFMNALHVANTILKKADNENIDISPMKLQKLIYIFYKNHLQLNKKRLFDEKFEVWKYGPVLTSVYEYFKDFGARPITTFYMEQADIFFTLDLEKNRGVKTAFEKMWNVYKNFDGNYLSVLTHLKGTAWEKARKRNSQYLDDMDILEEFDYEGRM